MSLSKRFFAAFFAFIIVPLFVLGSVSYLVFQNVTQEKYAEQTELTLKAIGRNINNMIKEANYFSDFWVTTEDSVESVEQSIDSNGGAPENGADSKRSPDYEQLLEKQRLNERVLLTYPGIKSVTLYSTNGEQATVNFTKDTPIAREDLESNPIYKEVLRKNGAPVWVGPNEDVKLTGENNLFTQIRVLLDIDSLTSKGILVTRFQLSELNRIFSFYSSQGKLDRRFLIVAGNGKVVFDNESAAEGEFISRYVDTVKGIDLKSRKPQSETLTFDGHKSLVSVQDLQLQRLGVGNWKLVMVTSWQYLSGDMAIVLRSMVVITLISLILALAFNLMFVRRTVTFIVRVVRAMRQVERGDLSTRVPIVGKDETTTLARGFNSLVTRVSELLDDVKQEQSRKRKAEMMLLQAQIKPHFLFNALESINILAVQNEGRKVSKMVQRLANIFRISIQQKEEITIEQELEHLTSYLEIQKYRFEELFEYSIDVPRELMTNTILKLTLQPLVENSIQHGFEGIDYMGRIHVTAREEGRNIAFFIEDNGIGISEQQMAKFVSGGMTTLEQMYEESPETGERRGLGVGNVADRVRIHYGNGYGLILCSGTGQGTIIKCLIPQTAGSDS
ncbi:cache domain-containing sensor histidine kinase [Cohnella lupini]|uniref:Histidine kinase/DNA gyrase B/HSP90-like ATPase n=1 Tax=Cohnella lupini TaxID=1294267 RepID=A0A3D9IUY8_9BACL|nr:sensor histidine kinase [Cohnella lupini]RED65590.1 histidine kinase/DNA gyrase B/HSP90-like ATPase [Cohnella lupini]